MKTIFSFLSGVVVFTALSLNIAGIPSAQAAAIHDEKLMVTKSTGFFGAVKLATRIYAPPGDGPFPLVVINHGKASGNPAFQKDRAFYGQAMEFVKRGYAVMVPTRQGFGSSTGTYIEGKCNIESTGQAQADDIEVVINYARTLPYIDTTKIVVIGQSEGGLATMALGSRNLSGVVGLVNMAGGLRLNNCAAWERSDISAFGAYGEKTQVPSLWMYGDNDTYWPQPLPQKVIAAYNGAGGHGQMVDFGSFENDSHTMFPSYDGTAIWLPQVEKFFISLGLSFAIKSDLRADAKSPDVEDIDAVPHLTEAVRAGYRKFLFVSPPRVFVVADNGHWAFEQGDEDAKKRALDKCASYGGSHCRIYAIDQQVVFKQEN